MSIRSQILMTVAVRDIVLQFCKRYNLIMQNNNSYKIHDRESTTSVTYLSIFISLGKYYVHTFERKKKIRWDKLAN